MESSATMPDTEQTVADIDPQPSSKAEVEATASAVKDPSQAHRIGLLTSGGDAQGMNAAVRAVARTALAMGVQPCAIMEGWQGACDGGDRIKPLGWSDVSNILHKGGTVIGTARSKDFRERDGMRRAVKNLLEHGIDRLIVIGGDGSLTGTNEFRQLWPELLAELVERGEVSAEVADAHQHLMICGLVGSIDNDLVGSDMTIGADSALHRIVDAIDDISSTAASHQRTFVVEVMGRHCGYLPLMAGIAGGCDYVFIPEVPPEDGWEEELANKLRAGRAAGRRDSLVLVAEGAKDRHGEPITSQQVADVLSEKMGEDVRVTILGHVQRGGEPSAYDRWMSTILGYAAVQEVMKATPEDEPNILGVRHNRVSRIPMMKAVADTRSVAGLIKNGDYTAAVRLRGSSFAEMVQINRIMSTPPSYQPANRALTTGCVEPKAQSRLDEIESNSKVEHARRAVLEHTAALEDHVRPTPSPGHAWEEEVKPAAGKRVAILHAGGLAPGMNTAARAAVRIGIDKGLTMLGVQGSFGGLIDGRVSELAWESVEGWAFDGGAELGTRRPVPTVEQLYSLGRAIENNNIDALMIVGGFNAYLSAYELVKERDRYQAFNIPIICVPASIDNNLPGCELSIGADTALNNAVWALDRIKESAAASRRCFVAETMGRRCGYLALMSGIAAGAELTYLHEDGITLDQLNQDSIRMRKSFEAGRRLFMVISNEEASAIYNRDFLARVFEEEGKGLYDVRQTALGHLQQGGSPTPFDRLLATRLVFHAMNWVEEELAREIDSEKAHTFRSSEAVYIGYSEGAIRTAPIERIAEVVEMENRRPRKQWWLELRPVSEVVSMPSRISGEPHAIPIADA
ncbi:6-phosphofructokinase [Boudabousia tangfeifanii]|uniref:6-phosphofructokinase n=1 Tax=Boudabousia tangfeifanii TaxID=1912795 RepID=UPI000B1C4BC0|nr:6-phosphofructokinase [Boudabousia tangfeifanii]